MLGFRSTPLQRMTASLLFWAAVPGALLPGVCAVAAAQSAGDSNRDANSGELLQQLVAAEKNAVDRGDTSQILASGKQLGALALTLLGRLYAGQGGCAQASDVYKDALQADDSPEHVQARMQTGLLLLASELCAHRAEGANQAAGQLLSISGDSASTRLLIGNVFHSADDLPGTIVQLTRAIELEPQFGPAHLALGNAYWELNEYQYNPDTLREFTAAQRLSPDDLFANQSLGFILSQYERYAEAAVYLEKAVAEAPSSPDAWLQLGMNAYAQNRLEESLTSLEKAVALTGAEEARNGYQVRRAYAVISRLKARGGDAAGAAQFAQREQAVRAEMLRAHISVPLSESTGLVTAQATAGAKTTGETTNAAPDAEERQLEEHLKEIVASSLNDAGTALAREHQYEAALPLFRVAARANPNLQPVMRNLGLAAFHAGAYGEAVDALTKALQQHPDDVLVRNDLEQSRALAKPHIP
jgi:tetratricopeptide (TPR) repeat protein